MMFVNSPKVSISEQVMFRAPDDLSSHDFSSHYKCCYYKCSPNTGQVIEAFSSWVRKQRNVVCGLEQLLMCMFSSNDVI